MQKLQPLIPCLAALFVIGLLGCQKTEPTSQASKKTVIAVIPKSTGEEFWNTVEAGAREAADELDIEMKWEGPLSETQIAEQNKIIDNMINLDVDGIALAPLSFKAMRKSVKNAVTAGIPVVIFDSAVEGDAHTSFVATNNHQGGVLGGEHLMKLLGEKKSETPKTLMLMRFIQGTASTEARAGGFIEAIEAAGLTVDADVWGEDASVAGCKRTASNTLEGFVKENKLEVDGLFACNDRATLGALEALDDLRKSGVEVNVRFVGFDFTPRLVESLQSGQIDALVVQNPRKMGRLAVETLVKHLRGESVEAFIDTGVEVATNERLAAEESLRALVGAK